jgi:G protein-coupled receptor GPR1
MDASHTPTIPHAADILNRWKSIWFGINAAVTLALGRPEDESVFCLGAGYLLFTGIEACDWAIFFQGLHTYLQIFPPRNNSLFGYDGLYRVRRWVLAAWFILPNISASLAFVNQDDAYVSQGGFCTLPIRPFWYRLALSWIPRYLIWLFTLGVAIRIYTHVGLEFQIFGAEQDESSSGGLTGNSMATRIGAAQRSFSAMMHESRAEKRNLDFDENIGPHDISTVGRGQVPYIPTDSNQTSRRGSAANWVTDSSAFPGSMRQPTSVSFSPFSTSIPSSRRGSRQASTGGPLAEDWVPPPIELDDSQKSWSSKHSSNSSAALPPLDTKLARETVGVQAMPTQIPLAGPGETGNTAVQLRRQTILRQLRLLFIYPVVYMVMWIMPFVAHAMSYSDYYAQHPIYAIRILNIVAQCCMGFVDIAVFCWREKPWRHIPGSDGSFWGSFGFWRFSFGAQWHESRSHSRQLTSCADQLGEPGASQQAPHDTEKHFRVRDYFSHSGSRSQSAVSPSIDVSGTRSPLSHGFSGISDRRAMEVDQAHARLRLERTDWERRLQAARDKAESPINAPSPAARKEWWESRLMSIDSEADEAPIIPARDKN